MLNLKKIGSKISKQRKQMGLTQTELANALYVTHQAVSKWENGKSIPSIEVLIELTALFDISIDYLLDNSEVKEDDFVTLFRQLPRNVVLNKYLNSNSLNEDIHKIFYLLNAQERKLVIDRRIAKNIKLKIEVLWPYLNNNERLYLLGVILSNKLNYDLSKIYHLLSNEERIICHKKSKNKAYKYSFTNTYNIRSFKK